MTLLAFAFHRKSSKYRRVLTSWLAAITLILLSIAPSAHANKFPTGPVLESPLVREFLKKNTPEAEEIMARVLGPILALALLPVMLAIALLVRLDSPGPALFKQRRIGYAGKSFDVYKFRTLRTDMADAVAARQVTKDDPRVTRVGYYLRKFSLDELPQLINVLRGEMSLIGPRPYATGMMAGNTFAQDILVEYARRRRTKPGMTGWSQVNGGHGAITSEIDLRRRLQHDLDYINRWSPLFDAVILWKTAEVVITGRKKIQVAEPAEIRTAAAVEAPRAARAGEPRQAA